MLLRRVVEGVADWWCWWVVLFSVIFSVFLLVDLVHFKSVLK